MKARVCLQVALIGLAAVLPGCIPSLHPLYTEEDLVYDPVLVGKWVSNDPTQTWTVTQKGEKAYTLVCIDKDGKSGTFDVHLLKIKDRLYLDLFPAKPDLVENDLYRAHLAPVHTFHRVRQTQPTLNLSVLKPDWLETHLRKNPQALRHETVDGSIVLTASPKELQAFLTLHDTTAEAWADCGPFTRGTEPAKK